MLLCRFRHPPGTSLGKVLPETKRYLRALYQSVMVPLMSSDLGHPRFGFSPPSSSPSSSSSSCHSLAPGLTTILATAAVCENEKGQRQNGTGEHTHKYKHKKSHQEKGTEQQQQQQQQQQEDTQQEQDEHEEEEEEEKEACHGRHVIDYTSFIYLCSVVASRTFASTSSTSTAAHSDTHRRDGAAGVGKNSTSDGLMLLPFVDLCNGTCIAGHENVVLEILSTGEEEEKEKEGVPDEDTRQGRPATGTNSSKDSSKGWYYSLRATEHIPVGGELLLLYQGGKGAGDQAGAGAEAEAGDSSCSCADYLLAYGYLPPPGHPCSTLTLSASRGREHWQSTCLALVMWFRVLRAMSTWLCIGL